jgi:DNA helicase II / ATP-dependent DNA helicase PcrA
VTELRHLDPLREPGPLVTAHQLPAVLVERDLFLAACPGSGKTRVAAVRVARLVEDGHTVALCSYTNTGIDELRDTLAHDVGLTLGPQHFSGTLHQFLLRYVLHPFGQLVIGCAGSPRVLGPDASSWPSVVFDKPTIRLGLDRFQFQQDGSMCIRAKDPKFPYSPVKAVAMRGDHARSEKLRLARHRGWVSMDDAMYWALQVLRRHPWVATAITHRFDEILVDEAQDTSELQLACLRQLHETGTLASLTLVGDLDQSIYSYNGAHPAGCAELARDRGLQRVALTENRRSSQLICNLTAPLHSRENPDVATGPDRDCTWQPELTLYPAGDPAAAVEPFRARLIELDEQPDEAAVLARKNDLVEIINGGATPEKMNKNAVMIARLVHAERHGAAIGRRDLDRLDRALAVIAWDREDLTGEPADVRWVLRQASMALLTDAPALDTDLGSWTEDLRRPMTEAVARLSDRPARKIGQWLRVTREMRTLQVSELVAKVEPTLRARTVHDIKGCTRSAVLLVIGKGRSGRPSPAERLASAFESSAGAHDDAEEVRISYVALTRARRLCRIALPDDTRTTVVRRLVASGLLLRPL